MFYLLEYPLWWKPLTYIKTVQKKNFLSKIWNLFQYLIFKSDWAGIFFYVKQHKLTTSTFRVILWSYFLQWNCHSYIIKDWRWNQVSLPTRVFILSFWWELLTIFFYHPVSSQNNQVRFPSDRIVLVTNCCSFPCSESEQQDWKQKVIIP